MWKQRVWRRVKKCRRFYIELCIKEYSYLHIKLFFAMTGESNKHIMYQCMLYMFVLCVYTCDEYFPRISILVAFVLIK